MEKIEKMIKAYNKKAGKWGYEKVNIVDGKLSPSEFKPKFDENVKMGIFKALKTLYRDGYLKEDYEKIEKLCQ